MFKEIRSPNINSDYSTPVEYNVGDLPLQINYLSLKEQSHKKVPPHWHKQLEIVYVVQGSMTIVANGKTNVFSERDFGIIDSGCLHFIENTGSSDCAFYVLLLDESIFAAVRKIRELYLTPVFHNISPGLKRIPAESPQNQKFNAIYQKLYTVLQNKKTGYELLTIAVCYELLEQLCYIQQYNNIKTNTADRSASVKLRILLDFICLHYQSQITIDDLCKAANISKNVCFRLFRDFMGTTPGSFILYYRLNQSRTLLKDSSLSISEIAHTCGFSHQSHFTRQFSREFGITPLQFRKYEKEGS